MKIMAPGKINVQLMVYPRNNNKKMHEIRTIIFPYKKIFDEIEISKVNLMKSEFNSNYLIDNNSVWLAYKMFIKMFPEYREQKIKLKLIKNTNIGSGLGFSASDAVSTIKLLSKHFKINLTIAQINFFLSNLGSDSYFFWNNKPALVSSYGQEIKNLNLFEQKKYQLSNYLVITNDIVSITADVYHELDTNYNFYYHNMKIFENKYYNILMYPALKINSCLNAEYQLLKQKYQYVMLSGAGSSFIVWGKENK